jgi:hypothetical protein
VTYIATCPPAAGRTNAKCLPEGDQTG